MVLRWLISAIGFAALKGEATSMARRAGRRAVIIALLVLVWVTALGFALAALAVWLSAMLGAAAACAVIAGGLAVVGLVAQVSLVLSDRNKPASPGISLPFPDLTNADGSPNPEASSLGAMAIVGIAGYLLGRQLLRR
jgi:hypothetical protein